MAIALLAYIFLGAFCAGGLYMGLALPAEWSCVAGILLTLIAGQIHLFLNGRVQEIEDIEALLYNTRRHVRGIDQKTKVIDAQVNVLETTFKSELDERLDKLVAERKALDGSRAAMHSQNAPPITQVQQTEYEISPSQSPHTATQLPQPPSADAVHSMNTSHASNYQNNSENSASAIPLRLQNVGADMEKRATSNSEAPAANYGENESPLRSAVRDVILNGKVNLHLQKIVSLPQRQVKFYECFSRPQPLDDTIILPKAFIESVRAGGMGPALDAQTLFRTLAIQRRLSTSERRVGLFCNMTAASFLDNAALNGIMGQVGQDRDIARGLIFELAFLEFQQHAEALLPRILELTNLGVRFSLDNVPTLALDCDALLDSGVRFLKVGIDTIEREAGNPNARPICFGERLSCEESELTDAFARQGISLIVDRIETEEQVARLLDWHIGLAQGFVFAPPKALRPEILRQTQPDAAFMQHLKQL